MGRAGGGRAGGGRSSGGGHSSSRRGGGHHVSSSRSSSSRSSSRAGSSSYRVHSGPRSHPGGPINHPGGHRSHPGGHRRHYPGGYRRGYGGSSWGIGSVFIFTALIVITTFIFTIFSSTGGGNGIASSTIERTKLETNNAYINDCIVDEINWFNNTSSTSRDIKYFYDKTGVQPYIILRDYDATLTTDSEKDAWAINYYEENFEGREDVFLFVYFAEEDVDNDVGYMSYANGYQVSSVMDSEAVEIFWNYIDRYWYTNMSTDDMFTSVFNDTADRIMKTTTTWADVSMWVVIGVVVIGAGVIVIVLVNKKFKRDKEKAAEDQRILETPLDDL